MAGPLKFPESSKSINKVVLDGDVKIDLTEDTVTPQTLMRGVTAHSSSGQNITGTMTPVLYGEAQNLTEAEKTQAQQNIGIDPDSLGSKFLKKTGDSGSGYFVFCKDETSENGGIVIFNGTPDQYTGETSSGLDQVIAEYGTAIFADGEEIKALHVIVNRGPNSDETDDQTSEYYILTQPRTKTVNAVEDGLLRNVYITGTHEGENYEDSFVQESWMGQPFGIPYLDADGKIPISLFSGLLQKPVLLWTNASPTSTLVTQDIAISNAYPFLLCVGTNGGFVLDNTERGGVLTQARWTTIGNNLHVTLQTRAIHRVVGGKVHIDNAFGYDFNVDSGKMNTKQDNTECILYQIWGIK